MTFQTSPYSAIPTDFVSWLTAATALVIVAVVYHSIQSFMNWLVHFDKKRRHPRSHDMCPSHKRAPPLLSRMGISKSVTSIDDETAPEKKFSHLHRTSSYSSEIADQLDMDHIYLPFKNFLWGMLFIWPAAAFAAMRGLMILLIRSKLNSWNLLKPKSHEPANVCYELCMYGTLAIYFIEFDEQGYAEFNLTVPIINKDGQCNFKDLELRLNLKTKQLVSSVLDNNEVLSAKETMTILFLYWISAHHAKIHSLANWAVDVESNLANSRNGTATVMYNYFGYACFKERFPLFQALGLLSPNFHGNTFVDISNVGMKSGIPEHSNIIKLAKHSSFIDFSVKIRGIFISEFIRHQDCFPNCNVEALFAGSVLHSLDHSTAVSVIKDELWLDTSCPKFGCMAELGRIIRAGFADDLPGLLFHKSFHNSGHPFYEAVYKKAAAVNKVYADQMDTCIIK